MTIQPKLQAFSLQGPVLLLLAAVTASAQAPVPLFYAGFNAQGIPATPGIQIQSANFAADGKIGGGLHLKNGGPDQVTRILAGDGRVYSRRGTMAFWLRVNSDPAGASASADIVSVWPGEPNLILTYVPTRRDASSGRETPGEIRVQVNIGRLGGGLFEVSETVSTGGFALRPGEWRHFVWTWSGVKHRIYLDGRLVNTKILTSPMPPVVRRDLRIGTFNNGVQDATLDEFAIYNYAMTPAEVQAVFAATQPGPAAALEGHALDIAAEWAPGLRNVHVTVDSGNDLSASAGQFLVQIRNSNGDLAGQSVVSNLREGFGESLLTLDAMPPETYTAQVILMDLTGAVLAVTNSEPYTVPSNNWLGNTLGMSSQVQPPFTPLVQQDNTLSVWGRTYSLDGGFGLPTQIQSQSQNLLNRPLALEISRNRQILPLQSPSFQFTGVSATAASWTGSAAVSGVTVQTEGRIEYDGMTLIKLRLTPTAEPVLLDSVRLQMALPASRALYAHSWADQGWYLFPIKGRVPQAPGTFYTNLQARPINSNFLFSVVFSDNDRALEWFAENYSGWRTPLDQPMQELIRDADGSVRLQCNLAGQQFTLDRPMEIAFGLMATPIKPLPADWRLSNFGASQRPTTTSALSYFWDWPGNPWRGGTRNFPAFAIAPVDPAAYAAAIAPIRQNGWRVAPFVNAQFTIPSGGDTWNDLNFLNSENRNIGGSGAFPTRATLDYWAYQLTRSLSANAMDGIYIDEPYGFKASAALVNGSGFIKDDGTHGAGYPVLGIREYFRRVRQLLIDNGKPPVIWTHSTSRMSPVRYSFADILSDGESYMFSRPSDPDYVDLWGEQLLNAQADLSNTKRETGGPWLLSISRAQKFGLVPLFLNYIRFTNQQPEFTQATRAAYAVLGLLDIVQQDQQQWFAQAKQDFGVSAADTQFRGFWDQREVVSANTQVAASYYLRPNGALVLISNFGNAPYSGPVTLNLGQMGFSAGQVTLRDVSGPLIPENGNTISVAADQTVTLTIPRHDFRMIRIAAR